MLLEQQCSLLPPGPSIETLRYRNVDKQKARREYAQTARELMQYMNARFDRLDPKKGDALSPAETLVDIHALTMMVDILTATYLESIAEHPYQ